MNSGIELHDSICLHIEQGHDGVGFVLLDAYVHRSEGRPGWEAGEGGTQRVRMTFECMTVEGLVGDLPACIYEGSLTLGEAAPEDLIGLPVYHSGDVSLTVLLSEDARVLTISGRKIAIIAETEFRYVEAV